MKLATFTANFKKVKGQDSARPAMQVSYKAIESSDIHDLSHDQIAAVLNANLEAFGKSLIAEKSDDWTFCPNEDQINWNSFIEDFFAPSQRGQRILSKANLMQFCIDYKKYLMEIGKSEKSAELNCMLIQDKFARISNDLESLTVVAGNLADYSAPANLSHVYDALVNLLSELMTPASKITADVL